MPSWVPTWPQTNMKSWRVTPRSKCQTVVTIKKLSEVDETETGYKWLSSYPPIIYFLYIFLSKQSFRIVMTRTKDKRPKTKRPKTKQNKTKTNAKTKVTRKKK